jgi:adenosylcobinamide-GDP ribazoletransferase
MPEAAPPRPPQPVPPEIKAESRPWNWFAELRLALVFLTILPIRLKPQDADYGVSHAVRAFPVAGIVVGTAGALAYTAGDLAGLAPTICALLAVATTAVMSGALHEDGLSDMADGLGGGRTRAQRLAIMRDSRIGAFGALALILAVALRVSAISHAGTLLDVICVILGAAIASRAAIALVMFALPLARSDGLVRAAGAPDRHRVADAVALGLVLATLALAPVAEPLTILFVFAGTGIAMAIPAVLARTRLGGQTGDVLGAVQQSAEIGFLLVYVANP